LSERETNGAPASRQIPIQFFARANGTLSH